MATPQKKGNNFIWMDREAQLTTNEAGDPTYTPGRKGALSILGQTLKTVSNDLAIPYGSGDPNYAQKQNAIDAERRQDDLAFTQKIMEIAKEQQKKNSYSEVLKEMEAKAKLDARMKQQQGIPLSDYEKDVVGYKDPNQPPSDFELWKNAQRQAVLKLGGSDMVGLSPDKTAALGQETQREYLDLKRQLKLENPEEKLQRAKMFLKQGGYSASNETAELFLKQNEGF